MQIVHKVRTEKLLKSYTESLKKRHSVVTLEAPFLPRDDRNYLRYSVHLSTKGWPGWVGLDEYRDGRSAKGHHQSQY